MTDQTELDNHVPEHRAALIAALHEKGLDAYEYHSGGGVLHVAVNMYSDTTGATSDCLMIATGDISSPLDVSLMGWRDGENVQCEEWIAGTNLPVAVAAFKQYADRREEWLTRYKRGELVL